METNSRYVKISGKAEIPEDLVLGEGYKILLDGEITSVSQHNNQNGSQDVSFLFKPAIATIEDKFGVVVKTKDVRSNSSKLKRIAYHRWSSDNTSSLSVDEDYDLVMRQIFLEFEEIRERAYKNEKR